MGEHLVAVHGHVLVTRGALALEPHPQERQQDGFFPGIGGVVQQGRKLSPATVAGRLSLERDLMLQV